MDDLPGRHLLSPSESAVPLSGHRGLLGRALPQTRGFPMGRHFLQIPGPTNVPDEVLHAIAMPTIDHRGPEFQVLGRRVLEKVRPVFGTARHRDRVRFRRALVKPAPEVLRRPVLPAVRRRPRARS